MITADGKQNRCQCQNDKAVVKRKFDEVIEHGLYYATERVQAGSVGAIRATGTKAGMERSAMTKSPPV